MSVTVPQAEARGEPGRGARPGQVVRARAGQVAYGVSVGVLCLECNVPFIPGDVGNASTYRYPVVHYLVPGATSDGVIVRKDPDLAHAFVEAAQHMAGQGVRAITGDCGYMATYQHAVAEAVDVPVLLSSLLQIPTILSMLGRSRRLGILCANDKSFTNDLLTAAGVGPEHGERLVIRGLQDGPHWRDTIVEERGWLDYDGVQAEVVQTAVTMQEEHPDLGGYLLECSDLPPYSAAIQHATRLPVFDWIGFIDYVHHAVVCTPYHGFY